MQIDTLTIRNLRAIRYLEMSFEDVTTLIGSNNVGKSTVLQALDYFFQSSVKITPDDFHKRSQEQDIEITIKFKNLVEDEIKEFGSAVIDGTITIKRTLSLTGDGNLQYSALSKAYDEFSAIRAERNGTARRSLYNTLAKTLNGLEKATNAEGVLNGMSKWEEENPDKLSLNYLRGFFGAPNVANGKLKKKTSLRLIPAVADAKTETSQNKSPIIQLLSDISKQIYENRKEVQDFITQVNTDFDALVSPSNFPQLAGISQSLTSTVQQYYSESKLLADWQTQEGVKVNFPQPTIRIEDQGFISGLEHVGHGLQRAALFAIIQFLSEQDAKIDGSDFDTAHSDIILLVEEPEIYQHPHKQSLICEAFHEICSEFSKGTGIRFQIVFTSHSEKFIDMRKFKSARILRRNLDDDAHAIHTASNVGLKQCIAYFSNLVGRPPMSMEAFEAKMHIFTREVCEGFFAEKIILVEGVTDKAILEGYYASIGRNPLSDGISIIQMSGKSSLDKPFYIFKELGIPVFLVFDSDKSKDTEASIKRIVTNRNLQTLCGISEVEDFPNGCFKLFSAFEFDLEGYIKSVIGEKYDEFFTEVSEEFGLTFSEICKTPAAVQLIVTKSQNMDINFPKFDEIIHAVDALEQTQA